MVLILGFLLFVGVVIPLFTLGMVFWIKVAKFLWLTLQIVCMFVWEFVASPICSGVVRLVNRKKAKSGS